MAALLLFSGMGVSAEETETAAATEVVTEAAADTENFPLLQAVLLQEAAGAYQTPAADTLH